MLYQLKELHKKVVLLLDQLDLHHNLELKHEHCLVI